MAQFPFDIVGFDLDGTLVDSNRDLAPAINHALAVAGRPSVSPDETRKLIGGGARRMLERAMEVTGGALPDDEFEAAYGELQVHYAKHLADNTVPYPGCLDALDALLARGCKLAVCTNKIEVNSRLLLGALGMTERFTAARNANVPVVALSFGYNDMPAAELGADAVICHYRDLVPALERLPAAPL